MINLSPLNRRRLNNFKKNRRAVWSFWIFSLLFGLSLFAEFIANDKPILVSYRGELFMPVTQFYPETAFGGDFQTEATYRDPEVQCLIRSGGLEICFDDPEGTMAAIDAADFGAQVAEFSRGWMLWPPVPYSYDTPNDGEREFSPNIIRRIEDPAGLDVRADGFPADIEDDEPEEPGYEVTV